MENVRPKYQTLHCHTTVSDGKLTYQEVLDTCQANNIGVVAFTDHDSVPDANAIMMLDSLRTHQTKWIAGIEISTGALKEKGGGSGGGVHMVGLFVDPTNKALVQYCEKSQAARVGRMQKIVKNLQGLGFNITADDCLKASNGESVGRPHIRDALLSKEKNLTVLDVLCQKMKRAAQDDPVLNREYRVMIEQGVGQYPFSLFLKEDAFIPGIYAEKEYWVDLDSAVSLIRNAGGLAILAHYSYSKRNVDEKWLGKLLFENRIDGAETIYGLPTIRTVLEQEFIEDEKVVERLVAKYKKVASGGVDAHEAEDFELFSSNSAYAERTIGMVERILEQTKVDTRWSSLSLG